MFNRFILFAALLLAPASALATEDICDQSDGIRCAQLWRWCHWDPVDFKCERHDGRCDQFRDPGSCAAAGGCIWDTQDPLGPRCESAGE
jgi:hypothetical protein